MDEALPHIRISKATKRYGPVTVLQDVDFDVRVGEVHVLAGENGAGKSTLIKILGGVITDYEGGLEIQGKRVVLHSARDAAEKGVSVIHQELSLVPSMSVVENLFLGDMPNRKGFIRRKEMLADAKATLAKVGLTISPNSTVGELPIAAQQLVEVAKALRRDAKVVIMDEPTSALNVQEAERLFALIGDLKSRGCGIVYISHKMEEIERLADRITVLRDGYWIATEPASEVPPDRLVRLMVGEKGLKALQEPVEGRPGDLALEVRNVRGVSFQVRKGEVLGLAGLEGSGNSLLLATLFGAHGGLPGGEVLVEGRNVRVSNPMDAIRNGIALLTSDRKANGLVMTLSVAANATLADLRNISPFGWRQPNEERKVANQLVQQLNIRAASLEMPVGELSGGNQQKVALAKWIQTRPKILLLDEPTRGIDVNAKREIYALIEQWKLQGIAIVLITSELPELILLSDRILVMHRGEVITEMARAEVTADRVVQAAMNAL